MHIRLLLVALLGGGLAACDRGVTSPSPLPRTSAPATLADLQGTWRVSELYEARSRDADYVWPRETSPHALVFEQAWLNLESRCTSCRVPFGVLGAGQMVVSGIRLACIPNHETVDACVESLQPIRIQSDAIAEILKAGGSFTATLFSGESPGGSRLELRSWIGALTLVR